MTDTATLTTEQFEDAFGWDSGLLNDVDFHIDSAAFTYNAKIGNGEVLVLKLDGTYTDPQTDERGDHSQFYKCGNGWEPVNGGRSARREDGREKLFNGRTAIAEFINAAVKAGVTKADIVAKGGPTSVDWVEGLTFHMAQHETDYGGEIGKRSKLLPTLLLAGDKEVTKAASKATNSAAAAAKAKAAASAAPATVSDDLRGILTNLAKECESHDMFIDRAFSQYENEVSGNAAAEALVVDPGFWTEAQ